MRDPPGVVPADRGPVQFGAGRLLPEDPLPATVLPAPAHGHQAAVHGRVAPSADGRRVTGSPSSVS